MMYGVNAKDLSVNEIIQLMDIIIDCGHCDEEKFEWHFRIGILTRPAQLNITKPLVRLKLVE
jgi:hypothetical protein